MEDFETRVAKVHRASTAKELQSLLEGLPTGNVPATTSPDTALQPTVGAQVTSARVRDHDRAIAVFGETKRAGRWIPARENQVISVLGSAVIDLREALLGPGETEFKVFAVLGSVEVIAPPGLYVESGGAAILGSFESQENNPTLVDPNAPVVRIDGMSVLGEVQVTFRHPGESAREARRRRRREKKERRRLRSGH